MPWGGIAGRHRLALGARRRDDADALVLHALLIAAVFALALHGHGGCRRALALHPHGAAVAGRWMRQWSIQTGCLVGAPLVWLFNTLSAVIRGTGNMALPAYVTVLGRLLLPLSPLLFGGGPLPALASPGRHCAAAVLPWQAVRCWLPTSGRRAVCCGFAAGGLQLRWALFADILRVGLVGMVSTVATNLAIGITTAWWVHTALAAIAGMAPHHGWSICWCRWCLAWRTLVAMVGTCIGAGQRERALRATWIRAAIAFAMTEAIGLWAAAYPAAWLSLFNTEPASDRSRFTVSAHRRAPVRFLWPGLVLYFASQGQDACCGRCLATSHAWW